MTQEDKELLLKDLCARLPYGVIVCLETGLQEKLDMYSSVGVYIESCRCKPYLRPMSSMTEEEKYYIDNRWGADNYGDIITYSSYEDGMSTVELADIIGFQDWLNAHHFDYRGLIGKGLAIEATEGMYVEQLKEK